MGTTTNKSQMEPVPDPTNNEGNFVDDNGKKTPSLILEGKAVPANASSNLSTNPSPVSAANSNISTVASSVTKSSVTNPEKRPGKRKFSAPEFETNSKDDTDTLTELIKKRKMEIQTANFLLSDLIKSKGTKEEENKPTKAIHVNIKPMMGVPFTLSLAEDSCVFELKEMITARMGITYDGMVLSFPGTGAMLTNDEVPLAELGIVDGSSLLLTVKVSSGQETGYVDYDPLHDFEGFEVIDVTLPEDFDVSTLDQELLERTSAEVKQMIEGTESVESFDSKASSTSSLSPIKVVEKLLEGPRMRSLDALNSLSISSSEGDNDDNETTTFDDLNNTSDRRGASIFQSPALTPKPAEPIVSSFTGASNCFKCNKKCRLAQRFECKCGHTFCPVHRYSDQHGCTFDFKAKDRAKVEAANPKVIGQKIDKF